MPDTSSSPSFTRMPYLFNVLVGFDQLGNAVAGGNPDNTVSARVGYFASPEHISRVKGFWRFLEKVIDFTFMPVQGRGHCYVAWRDEKDEMDIEGTALARFVLGGFVLLFCPIICLFTWLLTAIFPRLRYKPEGPRYDHWRRERLAERQRAAHKTALT
jgi:hypothetical protein